MKGGKLKTFGKVLGVLAVVDLFDIASKGHIIAWLKLEHPEVAEDWARNDGTKIACDIRAKMIEKCADLMIDFAERVVK